jgi:hypothetical protein
MYTWLLHEDELGEGDLHDVGLVLPLVLLHAGDEAVREEPTIII